jgi:hypothetical protein
MYPEALRAVVRCLSVRGIGGFLTGGTLLGAMRHGDFLDFDRDLDFGILGSVTPTDLRNAFAGDPDFKLRRGSEDDPLVISYSWRDKVWIDLFRFFSRGHTVWCGMYVGRHLMKWVHSPFDLADLLWHGITVKIPKETDRFLTELYGDWRTPNPHFGLFAAPNIEGGFPLVSRNIAYSAIYQALSGGERRKAINLCDQVLALDPGNALIRGLREVLSSVNEAPTTQALQSNGDAAIAQRLDDAFDSLMG